VRVFPRASESTATDGAVDASPPPLLPLLPAKPPNATASPLALAAGVGAAAPAARASAAM
jgi:hypothetical protein